MTAQFNAPSGAVPYNGAYTSIPSDIFECHKPAEGFRAIPGSILWVNDGGPANTVLFNCSGQSPTPFSHNIKGLYVDNQACTGAIKIVFPDTLFTIQIGANQSGYFPVTTKGLQFYVVGGLSGAGPNSSDQTTFIVYNHPIMPGSNSAGPTSGQVTAVGNIDITPSLQTVTILPVSTPIIITGYEVNWGLVNTAAAGGVNGTFNLFGFASLPLIWTATWGLFDNTVQSDIKFQRLVSRTGLSIASKGFVFQSTSTAGPLVNGRVGVSVEYRTP
jgi:hypothetical protein